MQEELTAQGFTVGPGGAILTIELLDFYSDFKPAFIIPTADSAAEVSFSVQVGSPGSAAVYSKIYRGQGTGTDAFVMTPGAARVALEQALTAAVQQASGDSGLRTALAAAATSAASTPAAAKPSASTSSPPAATTSATGTPAAPTPPPSIDFGQGLSRSRL